MSDRHSSKSPSQRQLKVGEEIRHVLADIFMQGKIYHPALGALPITVSHVGISPDLKSAKAYVTVLGGKVPQDFIKHLGEVVPQIRHELGKRVKLRFLPQLTFRLETGFDDVQRVNALLEQEKSGKKEEE
jgi:ribosome-binding factor A